MIVARAHHGSMSRTQRTLVEEALKSGQLPCVVATSSLELGIDMGAVDLVIQVEAPPSVASGLQRVGRAGHQVGAVSEGVVFPKYRGDLVSCAVVAERMAGGKIEAMRYPRNPLDVLAQHVVAMTAMENWSLSDLTALVRRAAPFSGLPDSAMTSVLDMLAGRYPSEDFGELRPRITWDRVTDELAGRPGAQRLAVTSGGTIPDRGLYTVVTPGSGENGTGGSRVGELDEEMVYESRAGDTFLLGSTAWRVLDITRDRVIAEPAPGVPARMPFWKGDAPGRPLELGRALGAFVREVAAADEPEARARAEAAGLDAWAVDNLVGYLGEQREATRHVPSDRTIVVERFRDELGDWRIVVHSPFGAQVNAPWALAIAARFREQRGLEVSAASADDGIVLRLPDTLDDAGEEILPGAEDILLDPDEVDQMVTAEVSGSAVFAARFRECAARSLLLPRRDPTRRTPLWQQRQKASQLLSVAAKYEQFPVVLETYRECLQDVYDVPGLVELMRDVRSRTRAGGRRRDPVGVAVRPHADVRLRRDVPLRDGRPAGRAARGGALAGLDAARGAAGLGGHPGAARPGGGRRDRGRAAAHRPGAPRPRRRGHRRPAALRRRPHHRRGAPRAGVREEWLVELESARRALRVKIAGEERWVAIEDAGRLRDALGAGLPVGVPEAFTEPVADPLGDLLARYARTRGPFPAAAAGPALRAGRRRRDGGARAHDRRRSPGPGRAAAVRRAAAAGRRPRRGRRAGPVASTTATPRCCGGSDGARSRGCARRSSRSSRPPSDASCRSWHGIGGRRRRAPGPDDVLGVVEQLAGAPIPASAWESLVLPVRLPGYQPALLDELTSAGEVTWTGCGTLAGGDGWLALAPDRRRGPDAARPGGRTWSTRRCTGRCSEALDGGGALFFRQLADRAGAILRDAGREAPRRPDHRRGPLGPGLGRLRHERHPRPGAGARLGRRQPVQGRPPAQAGPVPRALRPGGPPADAVAHRPAHRGRPVVARPAPRGRTRRGGRRRGPSRSSSATGSSPAGRWTPSGSPAGSRAIYPVLRAMEESGRCRRGYVVEGLGAAQFAVPGAIDRLRAHLPRRRRVRPRAGRAWCSRRPTPPSPGVRR